MFQSIAKLGKAADAKEPNTSVPPAAPATSSSPAAPCAAAPANAHGPPDLQPAGKCMNFRGDIMSWYIALGAIRGIPIRMHPFLPGLWALVTLQGLRMGPLGAAYFCFLYGPALLFIVLLHELGHAFMALWCGNAVDHILLWPLGGLAFIGANPEGRPRHDLLIALAGPATHLPQFAIFVAVAAVFAKVSVEPTLFKVPFWLAVCNGLAVLHAVLFVFNLGLPCYPLDGGRALVALLLMGGVSVETAAWVCVGLSTAVLIALLVYGIVFLDVFVLLLVVWIGCQVVGLGRLLKAGAIRQHPMFHHNRPAPAPPAA